MDRIPAAVTEAAPITTGLERTAAVCRRIVSEIDATKEAAKLLNAAQEERFECLKDRIDSRYEYLTIGQVVTLDCGCTARLTDYSDPWSKFSAWDFVEECPEHDSTPVEMSWCSTPQLWQATRDGYDGGDPMGHGKTVAEARADLIENEDLHRAD